MSSVDFIPDSQFKPDKSEPAPIKGSSPDFIPEDKFQSDEEKYGGVGSQIGTAVEGGLKGLVSAPVVAAGESMLSSAGVPGLTPADQAGRAEANPWTHGLSEAAGFIAPALLTGGASAEAKGLASLTQAGALSSIGEGAAKLAGVGGEGAGLISKIAASGVKTGAEMAALQAGDELAKTINQDPSQSLGTAAANIGLAGVIGGAGGAVLGGISPLWKAGVEKAGLPKIIDDAKAQYGFRQGLPGGDVSAAVNDELNTRLAEVTNIKNQMGALKSEQIANALPEATTPKINEQAQSIAEALEKKINYMKDRPSSYPARLVSKLELQLADFKAKALPEMLETPYTPVEPAIKKAGSQVELSPKIPKMAQPEVQATPIRFDENPAKRAFPWLSDSDAPPVLVKGESQPIQMELRNTNPQPAVKMTPIETRFQKTGSVQSAGPVPGQSKTPAQIFDATNDLKSSLQEYSKGNWGINQLQPHHEAYDFVNETKNLSFDVRKSLEDSKVWGEAGDIQRKTNAAMKEFFDAQKYGVGKFTKKDMSGLSVSEDKVAGLVRGAGKGTRNDAISAVKDYIEHSDKLADTLNRLHTDAGLEAPVRLTPTATLNHVLEVKPSPGASLGNWLYDKGLASVAGHAGAEAIGLGLGTLVGHPALGAIAGEKLLAPAMISIAKPLLENASHSEGFKAALDFGVNVLRGEKLLNGAVENFFKSGEMIPKHLIPDLASRERAEKSLEFASNPDNVMQVGGSVGHYMPDHATAAAATATAAAQYFAQLKPKQPKNGALDKPMPISKSQQALYKRQLDIAQQPLLILKYAKDGTLQPQDIQTVNTLFPGYLKKVAGKTFDEMVKASAEGKQISYKQRMGLSKIMGMPIDSSMTQQSIQAVMMANAPKGSSQQPMQGKPKKSTSSSMSKVNQMYATPGQARAASRTSS